MVGGSPIKFVNQFKYLAHIATDSLSYDDDILREVKNFFVRTNALLRKFHKCSVSVNLFKSVCLSFYDVALWKSYKVGSLRQFRYVTINVLKCFFSVLSI